MRLAKGTMANGDLIILLGYTHEELDRMRDGKDWCVDIDVKENNLHMTKISKIAIFAAEDDEALNAKVQELGWTKH